MPPTSTLRTPITPTLTLSRTLTSHAVTIEIHDDTGKPFYAEEIAIRPATTEPTDPEQADLVL